MSCWHSLLANTPVFNLTLFVFFFFCFFFFCCFSLGGGGGALCWSLCITLSPFQFCDCLDEEERAGCFTLIACQWGNFLCMV